MTSLAHPSGPDGNLTESPFAGISGPVRARAYLEALAETGSKLKASQAAGVHDSTSRGWRQSVQGFREAEREAMGMAAECLRDEAWRRAVEGVRHYKIGIGEDRRSRSFPSHTTRHAGPHLAVR